MLNDLYLSKPKQKERVSIGNGFALKLSVQPVFFIYFTMSQEI